MRRGVVQTLRGFGWRQWLVVALFVVALGATALYAARAFQRARYWREHRDEPIRGWMTVGYVAHSYRVPARVLFQALNLPPREPGSPRDRRPLRDIAREQNRTLEEISATLQEAIAREREAQRAQPPNSHTPHAPPAHAPPATERQPDEQRPHEPARDGGRP